MRGTLKSIERRWKLPHITFQRRWIACGRVICFAGGAMICPAIHSATRFWILPDESGDD